MEESESAVAHEQYLTDVGRAMAARRLLPAGGHSEALDRLSALARRLLGTTNAHVSIVSDVEQVIAGTSGDFARVPLVMPTDEAVCSVTVESRVPVVVNDAPNDRRVAELPPVSDGVIGSYLGIPLISDSGYTVGALCAWDDNPRHWHDNDIALLQELAKSTVAELELSALGTEFAASRLRWELAIDAAGIGSFDWNLLTNELTWDARLMQLFGYTPDTYVPHINSFNARIHPDDVARVTNDINEAIGSIGTFRSEYRVVVPDGPTRWVQARGRVIAGSNGRPATMLGAAFDSTALRENRDHAARILERMTSGYFTIDRHRMVTYINPEGARLLGATIKDVIGQSLDEVFSALAGAVDSVLATKVSTSVTLNDPASGRWFEARLLADADGLAVYYLDVTDRHEAQLRAEAAAQRVALLAEVTSSLSSTLHSDDALAQLAELVVPLLADWCIVSVVEDDGSLRDVGWSHVDARRRDLVHRYAQSRVAALSESSYLMQALHSGEAVISRSAYEDIRSFLAPGEARDVFAQLHPNSLAVLPLKVANKVIGLMSLFIGANRSDFSDTDFLTAREVAARAAVALDNARLYSEQRALAEALQRSLLTNPREPDHAEVVVRYTPASDAAQVGGDWYDTFIQRDGSTVLAIGDVIGHDTEAAAAMGQVRGLLRGIGYHSGAGPAELLSGLDETMEGLHVGTSATAVVARIERQETGTVLRWSNAGHPPPVLIEADGTVEILDGDQYELLLGLDASSPRTDFVRTLQRPSTIVLYTDGLIERRGQSLEEGLLQLSDALHDLHELPLGELTDALLQRLSPGQSEDDVAIVALRLYSE